MNNLYTPSATRPMQVVVFGSGSGTNLEALLRAQNSTFTIQAIFTDRKCPIMEIAKREKIPLIYHSFEKFFQGRNKKDPIARIEYDRENVRLIEELGFEVDLIVLAGYMRIVYSPLLEKFKIINVHPGDLAEKAFYGDNAVFDALIAGEAQTRSCVILVDKGVDTGQVLETGPWVPYTEGYPITKEKARKHQEKQKEQSDWPALVTAVQKIANGGQ